MAKQNLGGVYANMEFPPYEFREYPKHITTGLYGQHEVVNSAQEEEALRARLQKALEDKPADAVHLVADPAKEILISRAYELGVAINRKWSNAKLAKVVKEAEDAIDDLPPEQIGRKKSAPIEVISEPEAEEETGSADELKEYLISQAKELGIPANKLWGIPRLKTSIAEAKAKLKE